MMSKGAIKRGYGAARLSSGGRIFATALAMVCAAMTAGCPVTQSQDTPVKPMKMADPESGRPYEIYVPSDYRGERDLPLVITLHGSALWDDYQRQVAEWKHLAEEHGFIVAAPKLVSAEGILPVKDRIKRLQRDEQLILTVIDEISSRYRIDKNCVLLTGFSAGGYPLYYVGLRNPGRFDMLIARGCDFDEKLMEGITPTAQARQMPILVMWGRDDLQPIRQQSWAAFRWLREHGFTNTKRNTAEGGHLRRPELAWQAWVVRLPKKYRTVVSD